MPPAIKQRLPVVRFEIVREELLPRLRSELTPERVSILSRGELSKVVDAAVQAYSARKGIEADPTARRDLRITLIKELLRDTVSRPEPRPAAKRAEYPVRRPLKRPPIHPGALMREILEDHVKLTIAEASRRMKVSRPALYAVLNGSAAVSADMALRFTRLTGGAPELYLNMQTGHDLEAAQQRLKNELASIKPVLAVHH